MKRVHFILGIVVIVGIILPQQVLAQDQILVKESNQYNGPGHVPDEIIVKFRPGVSRNEIAKITSQHGISEFYTSPFAGFKRFKIPKGRPAKQMVEILSKNPNVEYTELNYIAYALMTPNDPKYPLQWHFHDSVGGIKMEMAWNVATGAGVVVAVIDTGVAYENYQEFIDKPGKKRDYSINYEQATDLAGTNFVPGYDFVNNDTHPNDDEGHGTHVTGTIAQSTNNELGVAGVAFNCSIMSIKVLNENGSGTYTAVADGIYYAADNDADIINMSLGGDSGSTTLENALAYAYGQGITIVCASGNDGISSVSYPAAYDDYCIAVGATNYEGQVTGYSNYGSSLDLTAPGGEYADLNDDGYIDGVLQQTFGYAGWAYYFSYGTSMAAPHVSGIAALVISENPSFTQEQVRKALELTATDMGVPGRDDVYGWGIVDAFNALQWVPGSVNNEPVANDDAVTTSEDNSVTIDVLANDTDDDIGDTLAVANINQPAYGSVTLNLDQTVTYSPNPDFYGFDSFTYKASDGKASSNIANVTVTVNSVNDDPVADAGPDQSVLVNQTVTFDGSNSDDPDGYDDIVSFYWDFGDGTGGISGVTTTHVYTSAETYTVTLTVIDEGGLSSDDTSTIIVQELTEDKPMHVVLDNAGMALIGRTAGKKNVFVKAVALVQVVDAYGPVEGATVYGSWSGATSDLDSGITDSMGYLEFTSNEVKNPDVGTTFTFTVDDVIKSGWIYDNADPSASIEVQ